MKKGKNPIDIDHLAKLAELKIGQKEAKKYQGQLSEVLDYIKQLNQIDVSSVESTSGTVSAKNVSFVDGTDLNQKLKSLKNLKAKKIAGQGEFFITKKVSWQS